ncbi:dolichyl-diphosphooligosaccharide--protein glycosyltransferase subunit stt3a [Mayamaea pseudoterrestris]|nr:dolichyl-diphosphooligosaccharide--protein glycosyltransferase subunit stt3a [Mayamaea pseudoterrestris]
MAASNDAAALKSNAQTSSIWSTVRLVTHLLALVLLGQVLYRACLEAYQIRLFAIEEYGRVIHEFDPYFNYRATEYLWAHGWTKFRTWFDYKVWYPLGRPVGTTIYPGMQVTSCLIKKFILPNWSINDVCVYVPAWFGVFATLAVAWLTYECVSDSGVTTTKTCKTTLSAATQSSEFSSILSNIPVVRNLYESLILPVVNYSLNLMIRLTRSDWGLRPRRVNPLTPLCCAVCSACIMAIVPAHLLRSVGGGYDNESIAVTAMVLTFGCWCKSLKPMRRLWMNAAWGVVTGLAYFNMVAAWGGYVFVLNIIGVSAGVLVLLGRYSAKLHVAYSCFYIVGTILATRVPVVGWTPLKSLEQMGPLLAFAGLQLIELGERLIQKRGGVRMSQLQRWKLRLTIYLSAGAAAALVIAALWPTGYFGPISSRVRGLFVEHTKTGNPLVDSVAEHQAASPQAYYQYLNVAMYLAPVGMAMTALFFVSDSSAFLLVYGMAAYFFSHRMVRLILLTAPITSALGGIVLGRALSWAIGSVAGDCTSFTALLNGPDTSAESANNVTAAAPVKNGKPYKAKSNGRSNLSSKKYNVEFSGADPLYVKGIRLFVAFYAIYQSIPYGRDFWDYSHQMAHGISHPSIIQKSRTRDGKTVVIDDYREAYWWLRDNTPEDARIMAWWDYGYQITGISERTTLADGNTWNHEHIALLGRTLTAPEKEAHRITRHLADYVLVWSGGGGDDLAKSPHLRRIANSVFRGLCAEPTCRDFGFYSDRTPTDSMEDSLLYKMVMNQVAPNVKVDPNRFKEVFRSKHAKVRIYKVLSVSKESKEWVENPANRICDAPGSWFCRGQYPPALEKILKEKRDFQQLEDFNRKSGEVDEDYTKQYMENLKKGHSSGEKLAGKKKKNPVIQDKPAVLTPADIDMLNEDWTNDETTTMLWELVSRGRMEELKALFSQIPHAAHSRSEDGRGPLFWAYENGQREVIELLKSLGVSDDRTDSKGLKPSDLAPK